MIVADRAELERRAAEVLIFEQTAGCCRLDRRCGVCDCNGEMQQYAFEHGRKVLAAVEPLIRADEREQVFDLVIDQHGSAFIHPDLIPQWENWLSKIRADERAKIITSLRRNRPGRPVTDYSLGYRDGITDTIIQIEKEKGGR